MKLNEFRLPNLLKESQTSKFINHVLFQFYIQFLQQSTAFEQHTKMCVLNYHVLSNELQAHVCHKSKQASVKTSSSVHFNLTDYLESAQ